MRRKLASDLEEQEVVFFLLLLRWLLPLGFIFRLSPEKIEKAVPFFWGWLSPRNNAVIVCVWTDIGFGN